MPRDPASGYSDRGGGEVLDTQPAYVNADADADAVTPGTGLGEGAASTSPSKSRANKRRKKVASKKQQRQQRKTQTGLFARKRRAKTTTAVLSDTENGSVDDDDDDDDDHDHDVAAVDVHGDAERTRLTGQAAHTAAGQVAGDMLAYVPVKEQQRQRAESIASSTGTYATVESKQLSSDTEAGATFRQDAELEYVPIDQQQHHPTTQHEQGKAAAVVVGPTTYSAVGGREQGMQENALYTPVA